MYEMNVVDRFIDAFKWLIWAPIGFFIGWLINNAVFATANMTLWVSPLAEPSIKLLPVAFAFTCCFGAYLKVTRDRKKRRQQQQGGSVGMGMPEE